MLTVNHVTHQAPENVAGHGVEYTRVENIYECERVTRCDKGVFGALELRTGDSLVVGLWGGAAYVMNNEGATVARYELPEQPADTPLKPPGGYYPV
jgi:hypothetical protein